MNNHMKKGFTIVELLIVIVVIAILAAIVVIAYGGITARAEQARFMSDIDRWEKSFLMELAETGHLAGLVVDGSDRTVSYPDPAMPAYQEATAQFCLPGDYPAQGDFREGECTVTLSYFKPDSGGPERLYARAASIVRPETSYLWSGTQADIFNQLPKFTGNNVVASTASASYPTNPFTDEPGAGVGRFKTITRGASIAQMITSLDNPCRAANGTIIPGCMMPIRALHIQYRVGGDRECGRGQKVTIPTVWTRDSLIAHYDPQIQAAFGMSLIDYLKKDLRDRGTSEAEIDAKVEESILALLEMLNTQAPNGQTSYEIMHGERDAVTTCYVRVGDGTL